MNKRVIIFSLYILVVASMPAYGQLDRAESKAYMKGAYLQTTFKVLDLDGIPVTNAYIQAGYSSPKKGGHWSKGYTDTNGVYTAKGHTEDSMTWRVSRDHYYMSKGEYRVRGKASPQAIKDKWQPWDTAIPVVLKPINNPIAMYVKHVNSKIPVRDKPIGFDFEAGDWVAPFGKGTKKDILFTYSDNVQNMLAGSNKLVIACSDKLSGIYEKRKDGWSEFISEYEASEGEYRPELILTLITGDRGKMLKHEDVDEGEYLMFRTRTVLNDKGELISAHYGKIHRLKYYGDRESDKAFLRFTYYFNPTANDRNLEFDPTKNLSVGSGRYDSSVKVNQP